MRPGTEVVTTEIVSVGGQQPRSEESGLRVNKTFSESRISRVWLTGSDRGLSDARRGRGLQQTGDWRRRRAGGSPVLLFPQK